MKIGILIDDINSKGGVPRSVSNLANGLYRNLKYKVEVISCFKGIEKTIHYSLIKGVKLSYLGLDRNENINKIKRQRKFYKVIREKIKREGYDVVISSSAFLSIYALGLKKQCKIIGCEHGSYNHLSTTWRKISKLVYKRLDALVLLTDNEIDLYKGDNKNIKIIKNMKSFYSKEKGSLDNNKILSIGRVDENKNLLHMVDIFKEVSEKLPLLTLKIIGNGDTEEIEKLENHIKSLNLQDKVKIKGFTKDVKKEYLNSDLFLMTSKSEGLPMVLVEAMSCGIPCISYDIKTGPREIIKDNETGFLIEPFKKDEMKEKIISLFEDTNLRKALGVNAYKESSKFDEKEIIRDWEKIIKEV